MPPENSDSGRLSDDVFKDQPPPGVSVDEVTKMEPSETTNERVSIPGRLAKAVARNPIKTLVSTLIATLVISVVAMVGGKFTIEVDNKGWRSRGTLIANREMQNEVLLRAKQELYEDTDGSAWDLYENNVAEGFVDLEDREDGTFNRRQLSTIEGCDATSYYGREKLFKNNLVAMYKTQPSQKDATLSVLDPEVLFNICDAETQTNEMLKEKGLCGGCDDTNKCLPPFSLLYVLRSHLGNLDSTCNELKDVYTPAVQEDFTNTLVTCVGEIWATYDSVTQQYGDTPSCPTGFQPSIVDFDFGRNGNNLLRHTSSIFVTYNSDDPDAEAIFEVTDEFVLTDELIVGSTYDTRRETLNELYTDSILLADMALAVGSLIITFLAVGLHTKSAWLTFMGILQVIFSVPLSYFVYYFFAGLRFFPFLNFIGVFVAAALGADDIFVAVDKWKNARIANPVASTEDVAAIALPDAAGAMLLTTSTTAVAFFATTICPVTPILCFAMFCGLLIMFNYVLNVILVFPALCLYDIWLMRGSRNVLVNCGCCTKSKDIDEEANDSKPSLIHRLLSTYYKFLHKFRYIVIAASAVGLGISIYFALSIKLPDTVEVRLLPEDHPYELYFAWSQKLLSTALFFSGGSYGQVTFGLVAADNGIRNNPDSLSRLVLDPDFNPSSTDAQNYLVTFCDNIYASGFGVPFNQDYVCPINAFDNWLKSESVSSDPMDTYVSNCNGADSLPMSEDDFDACFSAWGDTQDVISVFDKQGKIVIMQILVRFTVPWDAAFSEMDVFWNDFEDFFNQERASAPAGVNGMFLTASAFWWYDTNVSMLQTAIGAVGIAIGFSAVIVLASSRSLTLTLFSGICILYVLAATTSSLVGFGWDLGFLESICFAILVGISCDFVIHFGHAYIHKKGSVSKFERTKYAMIHMGPSILAAAITTFSAALVMLFCKVLFFTKFALILLMTVIHSTIGSFVVYLVLTDTFGPAEPTKFVDTIVSKIRNMLCGKRQQEEKKAEIDIHDKEPKNDPMYGEVQKSLSYEYDLGAPL